MAEGEGDARVPTISWSPDEAFSPADPMAQGAGGELVHVPRSDSDDGHDDPVREGDVDSWGRSENIRALARRLYDPVYRHWFRAEWEGLEHIPLQGGALLVANHGGAIPSDAPVIMHGIETELRRPVYGLADNLFRALPVVGTLWSRAGGVAAHPDNAYRLLHDEQQLALVFPEGTKGTGKLDPRPLPAPALRSGRLRRDRDAVGCADRAASRSSATKRRCPSSGRVPGSRSCWASRTSP